MWARARKLVAEVKHIYSWQNEKIGFFKHIKSSQEIVVLKKFLLMCSVEMRVAGFSQNLHLYENASNFCFQI